MKKKLAMIFAILLVALFAYIGFRIFFLWDEFAGWLGMQTGPVTIDDIISFFLKQ